ncbi:MAG: hypothetical protein MPN21_05245 [Thermoanaerobaculia bacterium]|nr:hypothetical protein [Thermoanaerobaculia bacterium]
MSRRALVICWILALGWVMAAQAAAQDLIFADGFESGSTSAWSLTVGLTCIGGTAPTDLLGGLLGPAPAGSFDHLGCLDVTNDRAFPRSEVAWSGIPLPESAGITDPSNLVLIGPGGRVASQFRPLSRWGGPLVDDTRPIRWLAVATSAMADADATSTYALRRYDSLPSATDPFEATIAAQSGGYVVDTGLATFVLDPDHPSLFQDISIDLDDDGTGRTSVFSFSAGAGPRLAFPGAAGEVVLSSADPGEVVIDAGGFRIIEDGPIQVMVEQRGHFVDAGGQSLCNAVTPAYERFGFTLVATFTRASRDVTLHFDLRNECSDGETSGDGFGLTDDAVDVTSASYELPLNLGTPTTYFAATDGVASSAAGFTGITRVEQAKGGDVDTWTQRIARATLDAAAQQTGEALDRPLIAVEDDSVLAATTMPWMRYREPVALALADRTLSLQFVGEAVTVGEGKAIWGQAELHLQPVVLATAQSGSLLAYLESLRDRLAARSERRLLVRARLEEFNAARLLPSLGNGGSSSITSGYEQVMTTLHDETVDPGGQWDRAKTYGSQLWPDVQFDEYNIDVANPYFNGASMNYWNALGNEAVEFLRSGDPKWLWEFTHPQLRLQLLSAYLNVGDRDHSNRNGVAVNSGGAGTDPDGNGEGHWHRSAFGSDDYTYDIGMDLAYAVHPLPNLRDRFAFAGHSLEARYSTPEDEPRDPFIDARDVNRGNTQHFEMLANCAEFVPGIQGQECHDRLMDILDELIEDNLSAALLCQGDDPVGTECFTPQRFMTNALMYLFFHRMYLNYGTERFGGTGGDLYRALTEGTRRYYQHGMDKLADGTTIDVNGVFAVLLDCDLTGDRRDIVGCTRVANGDGIAVLLPIYPNAVATLLMAHELDPSLGLCSIARSALETMNPPTLWDDFMGGAAGWWKGSAQMMNGMAFGVGIYETCN